SLVMSLVAGVLLFAGWLLETSGGSDPRLSLGLYLAAVGIGGWEIAREAWHELRQRRLSTDSLMILAALGAVALGEYAEGSLLIFLFSLGHALEERLIARARSAIDSLADLTSPEAVVIRNNQPVEVLVTEIGLGETVLIRPGTRFPIDGVVLEGQSSVDESPVTGESLPVPKTAGDKVFAATLNGSGALQVRATRLAEDSTLARVIKMVREAQSAQSPVSKSVTRFMDRFVPVVVAITLLLVIVPPLFGVPFKESFIRAMIFLVAASPCALAVGPSSAVIAGISQAARKGVLIKGGVFLEKLGRMTTVAYDKTGTLTDGTFKLERVIPLNGIPEQIILSLAATVEAQSGHPLARAVRGAAETAGLELPVAEEAEEWTGRGVQARVAGQVVQVGSADWIAQQDGGIDHQTQATLHDLKEQGYSVLVVRQMDQLQGILAFSSEARPEAQEAIASLRRLGIQQQIMLSGDQPQAARRLAGILGLDGWKANLHPEDKLEQIKSLQAEYGSVAMVGDGINDAPALAQADIGIAVGGAATDVALQTADVALMGANLSNLVTAVNISRKTQSLVRQNLILALGVMLVLSVAALSGWVNVGPAVILHETSTVLVVLNSLRILGTGAPKF
ncbi:MAG TPA: heavy metal translocating P-type ATPase, partial [Anaerolineales bacterium]|nr:heavy metal translocating P-type ATPase [Anaerolineales bacterium]